MLRLNLDEPPCFDSTSVSIEHACCALTYSCVSHVHHYSKPALSGSTGGAGARVLKAAVAVLIMMTVFVVVAIIVRAVVVLVALWMPPLPHSQGTDVGSVGSRMTCHSSCCSSDVACITVVFCGCVVVVVGVVSSVSL